MAYRIDLPSKWIGGPNLEAALGREGGPLRSTESAVLFSVASGAAFLVDAGVRLLSLSNQLNYIGKRVTFEFCREDKTTFTYLDRIGFFAELHPDIVVRPEPPRSSAATRYKGANDRLVEIERLRPGDAVCLDLPTRLEKALIKGIRDGERKQLIAAAAYNLFSELVGNVYEHSRTRLDGYAVLQVYQHGNSARIAVSDSGDGLLETLRPSLPEHYPHLVRYAPSELLMYALRNGGLSRKGKGHGAGLKRCADHARSLSANLEIRMPTNALRVTAKHGVLRNATRAISNMPLIWGSHVTFDFRLD